MNAIHFEFNFYSLCITLMFSILSGDRVAKPDDNTKIKPDDNEKPNRTNKPPDSCGQCRSISTKLDLRKYCSSVFGRWHKHYYFDTAVYNKVNLCLYDIEECFFILTISFLQFATNYVVDFNVKKDEPHFWKSNFLLFVPMKLYKKGSSEFNIKWIELEILRGALLSSFSMLIWFTGIQALVQNREKMRDGWVRFAILVRYVYKKGSKTLARRVRRDTKYVYVRESDLHCKCPKIRLNKTYIMIGANDSLEGQDGLLLDKDSIVVQFNADYHKRVKFYKKEERRQSCHAFL